MDLHELGTSRGLDVDQKKLRNLLIHLLRSCGGAVTLSGTDLTDRSLDGVHLVLTEYQDPWKLIFRAVEPEERDGWHDPTHGRIDRDIQEFVESRYNPDGALDLGSRTAIEETLQNRRNRGERVL